MSNEQTPALRAAQEQVKRALEDQRPAKLSRTMTWLMEDLVPIPGTKWRVGLDPVLSFIPAAGTFTGGAFGAALIIDAVRLRMPLPVLARMLGNWSIDWLVGLIPLLGPFLDAAWRSNNKNLSLVNRTIDNRQQVHEASVTYWITVAAILVSMVLVIIAVPVALILWLISAL